MFEADQPRPRNTLAIVLRGFANEVVDGVERRVEPGEMLLVKEGARRTSFFSGEGLELDWDAGMLGDGAVATTSFALSPAARAIAAELASALSTAQADHDVATPLLAFAEALKAQGLELEADALRAPTPADDQRLHRLLDQQLSALETSPMMVDFTAFGMSRRTLTRRVHDLQKRYRLQRGTSWREIRDNYRLLVASILLSHPDATARRVAGIVGYGSVEALDHAFRKVGMVSPGAFRRLVRASK